MSTGLRNKVVNMRTKLGEPIWKEPTFHWSSTDKNAELRDFKFKVKNILQTCNTNQADTIPIIWSWLGRWSLYFIETLIEEEQEASTTIDGLFEILNNKFRPYHKETTLWLQYYKLSRWEMENAEEWMDRLYEIVGECRYKEIDRWLKEQIINGLNMTAWS